MKYKKNAKGNTRFKQSLKTTKKHAKRAFSLLIFSLCYCKELFTKGENVGVKNELLTKNCWCGVKSALEI